MVDVVKKKDVVKNINDKNSKNIQYYVVPVVLVVVGGVKTNQLVTHLYRCIG